MTDESEALGRPAFGGPRGGTDMETADAVRAACVACDSRAWGATTYSGRRLLGNGLGDTGSGATWDEALSDLFTKHLARMERVGKAQQPAAFAKGMVQGVAAAVALAALVGLALWWAWR